ncbi:MAG: ComF family protein [Spirochaetes bacterium]|nr:ComF family protein [Spirochaetota bacterium]
MHGTILDILCPERCILCGEWIYWDERTGDYPLCRGCKALFLTHGTETCRVCSMELTSELGICTVCRETSFSFKRNVSLFPYRTHMKELIRSYKSKGYERLSLFFAELLLPVWEREFPRIPLVPVPPRPERMKKTGFDPIGQICHHLSRIGSIEVVPLLSRSTGSKEQKLLSKQEREENVKKAFFVRPELRHRLSKERKLPLSIVLLDDVFTTGATLHQCAGVLKGEGVQEVYGLTLARD